MNLRLITGIWCILTFLQNTAGQVEPPRFSGHFVNIPFSGFAEEVEIQTGIRFYYKASWVGDLEVTISGTAIPLLPVLDSLLRPQGLEYFLDPWNHLFLTDSISLLTQLPDYEGSAARNGMGRISAEDRGEGAPTSAEKNYIEGRRVMEPEVITVGTADRSIPGRNVLVSGWIRDAESGEPLIGTTIYLNSIKKGASTDSEGRFNLLVPPGTYDAECMSMGMEPLQIVLEVYSGGEVDLNMSRALIPLDEVVIRAGRYDHVSGSQMGYERLNYSILKQIPLVMGERDILNVVKMLPGVQSVGEGSSGFNVRGSGADQNMIYINKVPVYNSSHLFGFFTAFNPEIVRDFTLYKSNLPASFGGRLASFFDISTKQGNMKRFAARGGISSVSAYAALEAPLRKDTSSIALSGRTTYSDWILSLMTDPQLRSSEAGFSDWSAVYTLNAGARSSLKLFGYLSGDHFKLGTQSEYDYGNRGVALDMQHRFNPQLGGNLALIYSRYVFSYRDRQVLSTAYQHEYHINHYELRTDFEWLSMGGHRVTFGASGIYYRLNRGIIEPYGAISVREPRDLGVENGIEAALYLADELTLTDRLTAYAGLRLSSFFSLGPSDVLRYGPDLPLQEENVVDTLHLGRGRLGKTYINMEPRLNLRYLLDDHASVKLSYNRGYQYLFMMSNTIAMAPTDQWKLCDYHIGPQYLDQLSAGYYQDLPASGFQASVEVYRKWGHNIVEYRDGASLTEAQHVESEALPGKLRAYGVETMIQREAGIVSGWVSYTWSRSFMQVHLPETGEQINGGAPYPSNFDRPHNVSLVLNYKRGRRVSLSANLVYMTGRPVTYPVSVYYAYELPYIHYSDRNKYRIPDYFRFDLSINIEGNLRRHKRFHSFWMLGFYNVTGRDNAYSVYFLNENGLIRGYKLSIFAQPMITLSWNVKLGNYASE
jgi:hypothetical protein